MENYKEKYLLYKRKYIELQAGAILSRTEYSNMIQWLIDLAGTDLIMNNIISIFAKKEITIEHVNKLPDRPKINTIYYLTQTGSVGHWVYCSSNNTIFNSYELGHQKTGTNQFCQSFALMYMLSDVGTDKIKTDLNLLNLETINSIDKSSKTKKELENIYGNNIVKIMNMWEYFLNNGLKNIIIKECIKIDKEYLKYNTENTRVTSQYQTFSQDSNNQTKINENWIRYKLQKIRENAKQIALNT